MFVCTHRRSMSASFLAAMDTRADDLYNMRCELGYAQCVVCNTWYPQLDMNYDDDTGFHTCVECDEDDELCEFCGDTDDCLMMCEGCKKSGCSECVKSYIGEYFGDCKECCEKAGSPDGNGWESEEEEEEEDEEEED